MLGAFRKNKFFAWAMMGILVAAMAGFGLSGVLSGGAVTTIARVGDQRISVDDFVSAFQTRRDQISRQVGRRLSTLEARSIGLDQLVISDLLRDASLRAEARLQGISVSDQMVQAELLRQPGFQDISGAFDRDIYEFALQNSGLTAAEYDEQLREQARAQLVANALSTGFILPDAAIDALLAYTGERREISFVVLETGLFSAEIPPASNADLETHLAEYSERFATPATRLVTYAVLDTARLAETISVDPQEVEALYASDPERFFTAERRAVDRIPFPDEASANAALSSLADGSLSVSAIATERGLSAQDFSLGLVEATDLTRAERDVVFAAETVGVVGPVQTDFGPALFVINAILAAVETPEDEALDILEEELALELASDRALDDLIVAEELIAGGATVEEIANELSFELFTGTFSADDGPEPLSLDAEVLSAVQTAEIGVESDPVEAASGRVYIIRADEERPSAVPPLAEILEDVTQDWTRTEALISGRAIVDALQLSADGPLDAAVARYDVEPQTSSPITRDGQIPGLPADAATQLFALNAGDSEVFETEDGLIIAEVRAIVPFDTAGAETLRSVVTERQSQGLASDVISLFATARGNELGVSIDRIAIEQILTQIP